MKRLAVIFTLFLAFSSGLFAQNGTVFGKITDQETGKPVEMATVKLEGLVNKGAFTDSDGNFVIEAPAGTYTLYVRLVEYKEFKEEGVVVTPGSKLELNRKIESIEVTTGPIVITTPIEKKSSVGVLITRKEAVGMNSGVSGQDIARSPDRQTSQVLKRVSGASIQDNRFVIIRGLSDRYNAAQINGMALPSTEPDRKAFSFDIFPSAMLDNLIIQKTASPDLPGAFAGGVIQLNTRDIPEKNFFNLSASTNFNTQSTFKPHFTYNGGSTDIFGSDDGTRALPQTVPTPDEYKEMLTDPNTRYEASGLFTNDWAVLGKNSMAPGLSLQLGAGVHKVKGRSDMGLTIGGIYQYNRRMIISERGDYNIDTTRLFNFTDYQYKEDVNLGGLVNATWSLDSGAQKISFKSIYNQVGEDIFVNREGVDYQNAQNVRATSMQYTGTQLLSNQLAGIHRLTQSGIEIRWGGTYSTIRRDVPNLRRMYYVANIGDSVFQAFVPTGAPSPSYAGKYFGNLNEKLYGGDLNLAVPFKLNNVLQKMNAGVSTLFRDRTFNARVFGYVIGNPFTFDWNRLTESQDTIFDEGSIGEDGFRLMESTNPSDSYEASADLLAGYVLFDNHMLKKLRAVWGVRVEQYKQQLTSETFGGEPVRVDTTQLDVLPSVNLNYELKKDMFLRLSASRTVSRPELRELAPFSFYDFNTSSSVYGNDSLQRSQITNLDARWEIYPSASQLFAVTAFYKQFNNPIEQVIDASSGAGSRIYTFQNVLGARNLGLEVEFRLKANVLDSILPCKIWDRLTWFSNLSYINSRVDLSNIDNLTEEQKVRPLQGQSPYIINTGIQYYDAVRGVSVGLLFNRIGRRIFQVGSNGFLDIYEAPRSVLDLQVAVKVLKIGEVKLGVSDLLNQKNIFYQDQNRNGRFDEGTDTQFFGNVFGTNYSLGLALNF